jgi:cysteinyl-tRNA synthetase
MLTVNGQKMSKSLGNFITLPQMFSGDTSALSQAYSPMTLRFFFLQAHYRSPIDLSDDALQAARKGYRKLINGLRLLDKLVSGSQTSENEPETSNQQPETSNQKPTPAQQLRNLAAKPFTFLDDDLNTPRAVAAVFDLLKRLNTLATSPEALAEVGPAALAEAAAAYRTLVLDVLGLRDEPRASTEDLLGLTLSFYQEAKATKAYDKVDQIRAALKEQGIVIKDTKTGVEWAYSEE